MSELENKSPALSSEAREAIRQLRPDRWTAHDPRRCGADELPEGAPCNCGPFWPRPAAYWNGKTAIGRRPVEALIARWKRARARAAEDGQP